MGIDEIVKKNIQELYKQQENLKFRTDSESIEELTKVEKELTDKISKDLFTYTISFG